MTDRVETSTLARPVSRRGFLGLAGSIAAGCAVTRLIPAHAQSQGPQPTLTAVAEDVYEFSSGGYNTIFIPTSEGVIAADPLGFNNPSIPEQLKAAIASVTDQPVKYV